MTTQTANAAPAGTGTALRDTTRAEKSHAPQSSTLGTIGGNLINWTETAATQALAHTPPVSEKKPTKREQERAARQAAARVRQIGPTAWAVQSATNPEQEHEVHSTPGGLVCTCPAHGRCWHSLRIARDFGPALLRAARLRTIEVEEMACPTLTGPERLAAARVAAEYPDESVWGAS